MKKRLLPLVAPMLAAAPLAAIAQQPSRPMRSQAAMPCDMHGMMMGPMMGPRMQGPMGGQPMGRGMGRMTNDSSMTTRMRAQLGLSDAQMQQMRAMEERACAAAQPHMQAAMQAHQAAMQALEGDRPSIDHFEDQLDKAAKHMVEAQVAMAKEMIAFRNGLTPEQRRKMDQMHQEMMRPPR